MRPQIQLRTSGAVGAMGTPLPLLRGDHRHPRHRGAGDQRGERVGLFEFGSSASLAIRILQAWDCEVDAVIRLFAPRVRKPQQWEPTGLGWLYPYIVARRRRRS
jgi:hypothetical protein